MARLARVEVFAADEIAIVHVMNRTVRRCFLFGFDSVSGKNYDHRKQWIDDQLRQQAMYFGIDLLSYSILSNHFHVMLRSRPDIVREWSDNEVARRWLMLCPRLRDEQRRPIEPTEFEINRIVNNPQKLAAIRNRLSDISWWMRLLSQHIAQRANREDGEIGKFFQARYRAVRMLDETATLACSAYVDLNPVRARQARTVDTSDYTSAQLRARDLQARSVSPPVDSAVNPAASATTEFPSDGNPSATMSLDNARHLAPIDLQEGTTTPGPDAHAGGDRCSNKGFLPMSTEQYLELLNWTARRVVHDKSELTPPQVVSLLQRSGLSDETWCGLVRDFGRLFSLVAGKPHQIETYRPARRAESTPASHRHRVRCQLRELFSRH
jgi:hypothetical protein